MKKIFSEAIGWIGISLILIAYALNMFEVMTVNSVMYLLMNIVGSVGVVYISLKKKAYQPEVLNIVWILIALVALIKLLLGNIL
jgi:hypothetical protein